MRQHSRLAFIAGTIALATTAPALAADYDPPIIIDDAPQHVPVEIGSGWYLRGDVGYSLETEPRGNVEYRTFNGVSYSDNSFDDTRLSDDFSYGLGVGYSFTDMIRADVTLDRFTASLSGTTSSASPCSGAFPAATGCRSEEASEMTAYSALVNGYVDLGTFVGFTPYVGAGAGYTYVRWDDLQSTAYCVDGAALCGGSTLAGTSSHPGESDWRFTYAFMAGMAYDLSNNMKVDLGYRYRKIAGGDMFGWDAASAASGATGVQGRDQGLSSHEVRVGLRLELW